MPFKIVRNDITRVKADVIVNTANPNPICVSGTDLAIYKAAGKEKLLAERVNIGKIARGDIAVTGAYNLGQIVLRTWERLSCVLFLQFYHNREQRFDVRGHTLGLVKC